jgi:hypothetical protein
VTALLLALLLGLALWLALNGPITVWPGFLPGGAPGARTLNPRIKSLSGADSPGFIGVRAAGQAARAYLDELSRTTANCNPDCNPSRCQVLRQA